MTDITPTTEILEFPTEEIIAQVRPLSKNKVGAFFQNLWRKWLGVWYTFADKNPKASKLIYQICFFVLFSMSVTILQLLMLLFLPGAFGMELAATEFNWPNIPWITINGTEYCWSLFGYPVVYEGGKAVIGGGLGYFIAFEVATFTAQVINFPLQRNITYKSHGNPWYQAMWYFIGWVLISIFCNAINGLWIPIGNDHLPPFLQQVLVMIMTGGISMIIFFFIFRIIFPDYNVAEKRAKKALDKLVNAKAAPEKIAKAEAKYLEAQHKAYVSNTQKQYDIALTQASTKAMAYESSITKHEKAEELLKKLSADESTPQQKLDKATQSVVQSKEIMEKRYKLACEAIVAKETAIADYEKMKAETAETATVTQE